MQNKRKFAEHKQRFFYSALFTVILLIIIGTAFTVEAANTDNQVNIKVEVNALNLRTGPALTHTRLQKLPLGTPLQVLFREKENWLLVRLKDGCTGWVDGQYTSFSPGLVDKLPLITGEKALVKVNLLNVRLGPGLNYQKIKQLKLNATVTVYFHEGDWLLVRLADGTSGWIYTEYTTYAPSKSGGNQKQPAEKLPTGSPETSPQPLPEQTTGETRLPYQVMISEKSLRLREEPNLEGTPIATLPQGTILTVQQKREDNWLQVTLADGRQGWVAGWCTQIYAGNEQGTVVENYFRLATVNADVLRVRSGPGLQYSQTGRIFSGNHVLTLKEQSGWYYVRLPNGNHGWICGDYATVKNIASRGETGTGSSLTQKITIVLDPGHGGQDSGATGCSGLKEKDVNLTVALHLANLLRSSGFNIIMTRTEDKNITLAERVTLAEKAGADLFISIHANASLNNKYASGTETYYYPNKETSPQSFFLASLVQQEVSSALKLPGIGVKKASFHVLRETHMPAALVELAFLSNAVDETILRSEECLQSGAGALYRAVLRYYNLNTDANPQPQNL
ncbi:MAG: N-acetylmuramoyl-L-alanine amidase [Dethiobacteria bacterium]|jgi:N-acetylmuramoyl-L-alanine amidase